MQMVLYFLKRLFNFLKIDILLFKSVGKTKISLFLVVVFWLWCFLFFYNQNEIFKQNIKTIQDATYWVAFAYFFHKLKKQNFFYHLVLNRGFYKSEIEILLFLTSIYIFFVLFNIGFAYVISANEAKKFAITSISILIDAFLFTLWQIQKYILMICIFFVSTILYSLAINNHDNITTISDFTKLLSITNEGDSPTIIITIIETMILFKIIKNTNYLH